MDLGIDVDLRRSARRAIAPWHHVNMKRLVNIFSLAIACYGFAAWVYVAAVAIALPNTLSWQLTHLASWPRTDTFGELSFAVSFVAFVVYRLTLQSAGRAEPR